MGYAKGRCHGGQAAQTMTVRSKRARDIGEGPSFSFPTCWCVTVDGHCLPVDPVAEAQKLGRLALERVESNRQSLAASRGLIHRVRLRLAMSKQSKTIH